MEKAWLSQQDIEFEDRNVIADEQAMKDLQDLGVFSTPATLVDGQLIVGFDRERLKELLGLLDGHAPGRQGHASRKARRGCACGPAASGNQNERSDLISV